MTANRLKGYVKEEDCFSFRGVCNEDVVVQIDGDDTVEEVVGHLGRQLDLSGSGSYPSGSVRHKIHSLPNIFY